MRCFSFTAKNIGRERYLTYIMGEGSELDEEILDVCEEGELGELVKIIYEEDDDYDYLTYDVTGKTSLEKFTSGTMNKDVVYKLLRNIAIGIINCREEAIPLAYLLMNKSYMYVDPETLKIEFMCLPVESEASVAAEFKGFIRHFIAGLRYNVDENLDYVGKLLTYVNGNSFNLRGLIGLTEALMSEDGISFEQQDDTVSDDGTEVVNSVDPTTIEDNSGVASFMSELGSAGEKLPEIGDDDDEVEEIPEPKEAVDFEELKARIAAEQLKAQLAAAKAAEEAELEAQKAEMAAQQADEEPEEMPEAEPEDEPESIDEPEAAAPMDESDDDEAPAHHEESIEDIKARLESLVNSADAKSQADKQTIGIQKPIKVSRAALIQNAAADEEAKAAEAAATAEAQATEAKGSGILGAIIPKGQSAAPAETASTSVMKINPYLIRVNTEERTMINKAVFKIGKANRGVDYHISGNGAISRVHAIIVHKGDSYYIKDNKSTNFTYVNDVKVEGDEEVELRNNSKIRLSDEEFIFKLG